MKFATLQMWLTAEFAQNFCKYGKYGHFTFAPKISYLQHIWLAPLMHANTTPVHINAYA